MKNILSICALTLLTFSAQASDELIDVLQCRPVASKADAGLSVSVAQGGFAGITLVTINRFFFGQHTIAKHLVKQLPLLPGRAGSPVIFEGDTVRLSVNFSTRALKNGSHPALLITIGENGNLINEDLVCTGLKQIEQPMDM